MSKGTRVKATPAEGAIVAALRQLPPDYLTEVMRYIEFLQYKLDVAHGDAAEDEALWAAVEANQEYKRLHPDEDLEVYETGDAFLEAVKDL
jgi:hypothetical protein